jgi:hypothetical protein
MDYNAASLIASAIDRLTSAVGTLVFLGVLFLFFKDMGRGSDVAHKMKDKEEKKDG